MKTWTEKQINELINLYPFLKSEEVAEILHKTKSSIDHKASRLKIKKDQESIYKIKSNAMKGKNSGNFKHYKRKTSKGYIALYKPDYPQSSKNGIILEHRYIMEQHIRRPLSSDECIHHIDGNKTNNELINLKLMKHGEHSAMHSKERKNKI